MAKTYVIGVAPGGAASLTPRTLRLVSRAEIVCGGQRLLDMFPSLTGEKIVVGHNLSEIAGLLKENLGRKRVVVLASGDPGLYGIAAYLAGKLPARTFEVIPNVSAMQVAFARIGESWHDAALVSVHARPVGDIIDTVRSSDKIGIFTDREHTPSAIAKALLENGLNGYRAYVCENLGEKNERITRSSLKGLCGRGFSPLNVLILIRKRNKSADSYLSPALGIPDEAFHRRRPGGGLITKQEIRAVSLAKLRLGERSVVWDIGAGSGAMSIEASRLAGRGHVYAVEKNSGDIAVIRRNIRKFRASNVTAIHLFAPEGLGELPTPTAVFIGGSGGRLEDIIEYAVKRLRPGGRIVINIVGLENLNAAVGALQEGRLAPEIMMVSVARGSGVGELTRLEALNPVFVVAAGGEDG